MRFLQTPGRVISHFSLVPQIARAIGVLTSNGRGAAVVALAEGVVPCWGAIRVCYGGVLLLRAMRGGCHGWGAMGGVPWVGCRCWVPCWGAIRGCHGAVLFFIWICSRVCLPLLDTGSCTVITTITLKTQKLVYASWGLCWNIFFYCFFSVLCKSPGEAPVNLLKASLHLDICCSSCISCTVLGLVL